MKRWLITGAGGQFGSVLLETLVRLGEPAIGWVSPTGVTPHVGETQRVDILDRRAMERAIRAVRPGYVVHAAALADAGAAYADPDLARRTNVEATHQLAALAADVGAKVAFTSTDLVFDGTAAPYAEDAVPTPTSVYGRTKADAEHGVRGVTDSLILRVAIMFGIPAAPRRTVFLTHLATLQAGRRLELFEDQYRTPISLADAAHACIESTCSGCTGTLNIAGPERLSRYEMGVIMAEALGQPSALVVPNRQRDRDVDEPRPGDSSLDGSRFTRQFGRPAGRPMAQVMREIVAAGLPSSDSLRPPSSCGP